MKNNYTQGVAMMYSKHCQKFELIIEATYEFGITNYLRLSDFNAKAWLEIKICLACSLHLATISYRANAAYQQSCVRLRNHLVALFC